MNIALFFLSLLVFVPISSALGSTPQLTVLDKSGKAVSFTPLEMQKKFGAEKITVMEPHELRKVEFIGVALDKILDEAFGPEWKQQDELLFTCVDGYQPSIPIQNFTTGRAYLAYGRTDQKDFTVHNKLQNEKKVPLGPFYLIWQKQGNNDVWGASHWPYQVAKMEFITFKEKFSHLYPKEKTSAKVNRGFVVFRNKCINCHTINGQGGKKGVELNYPASVTEYIKKDWLKKWIRSPRSVRYSSTMSDFPGSDEELDAVIAYLEAMSRHKMAPAL